MRQATAPRAAFCCIPGAIRRNTEILLAYGAVTLFNQQGRAVSPVNHYLAIVVATARRTCECRPVDAQAPSDRVRARA